MRFPNPFGLHCTRDAGHTDFEQLLYVDHRGFHVTLGEDLRAGVNHDKSIVEVFCHFLEAND